MPPRDWKLRVRDILDAIAKIQRYAAGTTREQFAHDTMVIDAIVHNFSIIGEAAGHVPKQVCERFADVPWEKMRAIRNIVVHQYFGVSTDIIWETIAHDLPGVVPLLQHVLAEDR